MKWELGGAARRGVGKVQRGFFIQYFFFAPFLSVSVPRHERRGTCAGGTGDNALGPRPKRVAKTLSMTELRAAAAAAAAAVAI